jgi:hypothetical protein
MNVQIMEVDQRWATLGEIEVKAPYAVNKAWYDKDRKQVIVLMDYSANRHVQQFRNLLSYDLKNEENWKAELPTKSGADAYVDAEFISDNLSAFSFSCFRCRIDLSNGKVIEKLFSK